MKKLVAYSSVSHLGFVVLGLCALNVNGVQGAVYQMLAHGISTGGLFLIVGMLSDRRHTRQIAEFGGLKAVMPQLVAAFLLITLASVALPGMNGFVGEFLILIGAFGSSALDGARVYTAIAATGVILSAVYMLWMFQRVNYGPLTNDKNRGLRDLSVREWFVIAPDLRHRDRHGRGARCLPEADGAGRSQDDRADRRRAPRPSMPVSRSASPSERRAESPRRDRSRPRADTMASDMLADIVPIVPVLIVVLSACARAPGGGLPAARRVHAGGAGSGSSASSAASSRRCRCGTSPIRRVRRHHRRSTTRCSSTSRSARSDCSRS